MTEAGGKRHPRRRRKRQESELAELKVQVRELNATSRALAFGYEKSLDQALQSTRRFKRSSALTRAAFWALRASTTGWALVCNRRIVAANPAFARFDDSISPREGWRPYDAGRGGTLQESYRSLRDLALAESLRVEGSDERQLRRWFMGGQKVVEVRAEPSQVQVGLPAILVFVDDITERAAAESQARAAMASLLQQERLRTAGELAIGIGHDMNNLFGALVLWLEPLLRDEHCRARYGSNVDALRRITEDGRQLLHKLQRIGKQDDRTIAPVDLRDVIDTATQIAQGGLRIPEIESGLRIRFLSELPPLPKVAAVADELRSVFLNLFINARDAMPEGGTITVTGRAERDAVVISVEDEGTGIDPLHLPHLFDAFFTTKGDRGTGMGLAMARAVLEGLGGRISARNRAGGGAVFELRFLPLEKRTSVASDSRPPLASDFKAARRPPMAARSNTLNDAARGRVGGVPPKHASPSDPNARGMAMEPKV